MKNKTLEELGFKEESKSNNTKSHIEFTGPLRNDYYTSITINTRNKDFLIYGTIVFSDGTTGIVPAELNEEIYNAIGLKMEELDVFKKEANLESLIKWINNEDKYVCADMDYVFDEMPKDIYNQYKDKNITEVDTNLNYDEHRWYATSTNVYSIEENGVTKYFGLNGVCMSKSESQSISDLFIPVNAFEMEQVPSVAYREKK